MSDSCYLEIEFRKKDLGKIIEILGESPWDETLYEEDRWMKTCINEANHSLYNEREEIAEAGIPFVGWHSPGDEYHAFIFCSNGDGRLREHMYFNHELIIPIQWLTKSPDNEALEKAAEFITIYDQTQAVIRAPAEVQGELFP